MRRKNLAVEILRTLRILKLRRQHEKEFNEGKTYASELKAVEICLNPLIRGLEEKPIYCIEKFDNEEKCYKPVAFTSTTKLDLSLLKKCEKETTNTKADFRIGRYFREMEI